ncbi:MAG: carbon-nitrogen hydrolase family protein [Parvibaculum sp.]|nr:carbon-nitrogen hydrolase family protein [Parvibaculum sp.]
MKAAPTFTAALVQMRAGRDVAVNIADVSGLVSEAAAHGSDLVMTPEMTSLLETNSERLFANTFEEKDDPTLAALRVLAATKKIWLLIGSLPVKVSPQKLANRSFLIAPDGCIAARYDKIHMFDVDLEGGESYRESKNFEPGRTAVIADLPWGRLGMTVCYDLRFPQLYRALAQAGAGLLTVPAAFTRQTGEAHWHTLLKARAVETGCYMFAPAQGGKHECGRETFGHSLVVAPWGEIVAEAAHDAPCVVLAEIDTARIAEARGRVPSLGHDREFALPVVKAVRQVS